MNDLFKNAKVGDKAIVTHDRSSNVGTVTRVGPRCVSVNNVKFFRCDGRSTKLFDFPGMFEYARLISEEDDRQMMAGETLGCRPSDGEIHRLLVKKCHEIDFDSLSDHHLMKILRIADRENVS
jgi:hypothetical protein